MGGERAKPGDHSAGDCIESEQRALKSGKGDWGSFQALRPQPPASARFLTHEKEFKEFRV